MTKCFGALTSILTFAMLVAAQDAVAAARQKHAANGKQADAATAAQHKQAPAKSKGAKSANATNDKPSKRDVRKIADAGIVQVPLPPPRPAPPLVGNLGALKQAMELIRAGKTGEATALKSTVDDKVAQVLIEWFILRHPNGQASFRRYAAFIEQNPNWPSIRQLRRRAEGRLWQEKSDPATVHWFTADQPVSGTGHLALARALLNEADRDGAAREVRKAWRSQQLSERLEGEALEVFRDLLTRDDHLARMDKRIGAKDLTGAARAASRVGSDANAIVKACAAVKFAFSY